MKGMDSKRMAWVLVIAILAGCFANYGAVRAEDPGDKYLYLEDSCVRLSVSEEDEDFLSGTLAVTGSAVSSSQLSGNFYVTTGGTLTVTGGAVSAGALITEPDAIDQIINESNALKKKVDYTVGTLNQTEDEKYSIEVRVNKEIYDSCSYKEKLKLYYKPEDGEGVYYLGQFDTKRMYQVDFVTNGGSKVKKQSVERGNQAKEPDAPTYDWHSFKGWYTEEGLKFDFKEAIEKDITLYAKWEKVKYEVTFKTQGGDPVEDLVIEVERGEMVGKPKAPTRKWHLFKGWYTEEGSEFNFGDAIEKNITLYAKWEKVKYKVTFDTQGGNPVEGLVIEVEGGEKVEKPDAPTREWHSFKGWYTKEGSEFDFGKAIENDVTIYAKWEKVSQKVEYTITYDPEGGSMPPNYIKQYETGKGLEEKAMPVPSREGYLFGGWYSDKGRLTGIPLSMAENLKLKAKWYAVSITCDQNRKYVAKGTVLTLGVEIDSSIKEQCKFIWSNGRSEKEGATVVYEVEGVGVQNYVCKVIYGSYSHSTEITFNGYKEKVDITLYKTKSTKDIFGKKVPLETLAFAKNKKKNKKYLTLNKKKGTIKVKKYVKSVKLTLKVEGQKIMVTVSVKLPKPKINIKKIKNIYRGYDSYKLTYSNIKGADRIVLYYSRKKNKGYKKGGKRQNSKKGVKVSIPKSSKYKYYYKVVAYYGKTKSPQSTCSYVKI